MHRAFVERRNENRAQVLSRHSLYSKHANNCSFDDNNRKVLVEPQRTYMIECDTNSSSAWWEVTVPGEASRFPVTGFSHAVIDNYTHMRLEDVRSVYDAEQFTE